jgi:ribonuclease BN (tRNA processing enzyme)
MDLGPDTLLELRKHTDFRAVDAVVISHLHVDHMLDVIAMRFSLAYNPVKPDRRVPLWLPPGGIEMFAKLGAAFDFEGDASTFFSRVFDVQEYNPEGHLAIGTITISFAPTVHWVPCWAMRLHPDDGTGDIFYTADTGPAADLKDFASGARVVIAEATTPLAQRDDQEFQARGHLTIEEAASLANDAGAQVLVATHMFEENDPNSCIATAASIFSGEIVRATPGATVSWP